MPIRRVSPEEALELVRSGAPYIDVRSETEFSQGHPQHAFNIPLMKAGPGGMVPNDRFVECVAAHFDKDALLVLGCLAGGRSARAAALLEQAGFSNLADQAAGWGGNPQMQGWSRLGLPSAKAPDAGRSFAELEKKTA